MNGRSIWIGGVLLALVVAGLLSPWASPWPDGLDRTAQRLGFQVRQRERPILPAPLPDYKLAAVRAPGGSMTAAGVVGTLAAFGSAWVLGRVLTRRRSG